MKKHRLACMQLIGLVLTICCCAGTCLAQPVMSRGQQQLNVNYNECLNRARQALGSAGFVNIGVSGNFANGFKEASGAYITCNDAPGGGMVVNIFVATIANDSGVPGYLRQCLQAQMERPGTGCGQITPPVSTGTPPPGGTRVNLVSKWSWSAKCNNQPFTGTFQITTQGPDGFSGSFLSDNSSIRGQVTGDNIQFTRHIPAGDQKWAGMVRAGPGGLHMDGTLSGYGGPCSLSATATAG